eukprot:gene25765-32254_t
MTDPEIGEIETHETSGKNTDPEISPTEKPYTPVPNEWVLHWSSEFESYYYYNVVTMESTWDCPDEALHYEYQEQEWTEEELAEFAAAAEQATIERPGVEILTAGSHDLLCISTDENDTDVSNKTDGELNLVYKYNHPIRVHHSVEEILSHPDAVDADSDAEEDMTIVESPRPPAVSGVISKPIAARLSSGNKPVKDLFFSENSAKRMSLNRLSLNANSPEKLSPRGASFRARMIAIAESASGSNSVRSPPPALRSPLPRNCSEKASSPRATAFIKTSETPRPAATLRSPRECPPAPHSTPLLVNVTTAPAATAPVALLPTSREDEVYFESPPEHGNAQPVVVESVAVETHTVPPPHPPSTANPHHRVFDVNAPAPQAGSVAFVVDNGTEGSHPAPPPPPPKISHIPVHVSHHNADSASTSVDSAVRPQSAVQQRIANLQQKEHQNSSVHRRTTIVSYSQTYYYNGVVQTFAVPSTTTSISVNIYGAAGGSGGGGNSGYGALVSTTLTVTPGTTLYLYCGGMGSAAAADTLTSLGASLLPLQIRNQAAFAALNLTGGVLTWGSAADGGDSSAVSHLLVNVKKIVACVNAFAALKYDGTVVTWGRATSTTGCSAWRSGVNLTSLYATGHAFAGLAASGDSNLNNVKQIFASKSAFAALTQSGAVLTWGEVWEGDKVVSGRTAFVAYGTSHGLLSAWGLSTMGGDMASVHSNLKNITRIYSNGRTFAALNATGGVVAWGHGGS